MPPWWGRINRWILGPGASHRSSGTTLVHVGRNCGRRYETPLHALQIADGFAFVVPYTQMNEPAGEWVRNVLASGSARLRLGGEVFSLVNPRLEAFGAAKARLLQQDVELVGVPKLGDMLLVMDQHHRCASSCNRRRRPARCGRCAGQCPSQPASGRPGR